MYLPAYNRVQGDCVNRSRHNEPPFVNQETESVNGQLTRERLLSIHKVADEDEEHDEDVKVHG
jgi:hypothetical protein